MTTQTPTSTVDRLAAGLHRCVAEFDPGGDVFADDTFPPRRGRAGGGTAGDVPVEKPGEGEDDPRARQATESPAARPRPKDSEA